MKAIKIFFLSALVALFGLSACNQSSQDADHMEGEEMHEEGMGEHMEDEEMGEEMDHSMHQPAEGGSVKSPRKTAMANVGDTHVHIDYAAPSKRDREIFGGLVAYNEVWVTGAHKATSIQFYNDVMVEGEKVAKGTYALFTIPGKDEWTVILNKNHEQHLADDYNEADDVLRFKVTPTQLDEPVEQMTFNVEPGEGNQGQVTLAWDKTKISFDVEDIN